MKLPQLTLRDLFWLVALVAMGCGWWVDRHLAVEAIARRYRNLMLTADQMALFIEKQGHGVVAWGEWGVNINDITQQRPADWSSLSK